jgi:hypothetical protein
MWSGESDSGIINHITHDNDAMFANQGEILGYDAVDGLILPADVAESMREDKDAAMEARQEAEREEELTFTVETHHYNASVDWPTSAVVCKPNKTLLSEEQEEAVARLKDVFGAVDEDRYVSAPEETKENEEYTLADLIALAGEEFEDAEQVEANDRTVTTYTSKEVTQRGSRNLGRYEEPSFKQHYG